MGACPCPTMGTPIKALFFYRLMSSPHPPAGTADSTFRFGHVFLRLRSIKSHFILLYKKTQAEKQGFFAKNKTFPVEPIKTGRKSVMTKPTKWATKKP